MCCHKGLSLCTYLSSVVSNELAKLILENICTITSSHCNACDPTKHVRHQVAAMADQTSVLRAQFTMIFCKSPPRQWAHAWFSGIKFHILHRKWLQIFHGEHTIGGSSYSTQNPSSHISSSLQIARLPHCRTTSQSAQSAHWKNKHNFLKQECPVQSLIPPFTFLSIFNAIW